MPVSQKPRKKKKRRIKMQVPKIAPGILPGVKPEDLTAITCKCGASRFLPVCELKHASRFQTEVGQPMLVNFQGGYACVACGALNEFDTSKTELKSGKAEKEQDSVNN